MREEKRKENEWKEQGWNEVRRDVRMKRRREEKGGKVNLPLSTFYLPITK